MQITWFGDKIVNKIQKALSNELGASAEKIAIDARIKVPQDSEVKLLKSTIEFNKNIMRDGVCLAYVQCGSTVSGGSKSRMKGQDKSQAGAFYAGFVELGTERAAAKPFFRPAIKKNKAGVLRGMSKALTKVLR